MLAKMNGVKRLLVNERQMAALLNVSWGHMINLRRRRMDLLSDLVS